MTDVISSSEARLVDALRDVQDPELPISIVDLGLLVDLRHADRTVDVQITLTAMGCPAVEMIVDDIRERLLRETDVETVRVEIVWDPIWSKDRLSDEGKMQLRELGVAV